MEKKKIPSDINQLAHWIGEQATQEKPASSEPTKEKNPAAVSLGRLGGLKGGPARAKALSSKKRKEIAKKAARKRWSRS
ncbi:MAG: hypothetical protein ABSE95_19110 [Thermodesulfobacteriota bacterium]|jgi:hypothetical protein